MQELCEVAFSGETVGVMYQTTIAIVEECDYQLYRLFDLLSL